MLSWRGTGYLAPMRKGKVMQLSKTFRLANGDRAVIDLRLEHVSSARGTVRHGESLPYGYVRVSISGELTPGYPFRH